MKPKYKKTISRLVGTFKTEHGNVIHDIDIPAGTVCEEIRGGSTAGKFFVHDLSWIKDCNSTLYHDAYFYGIILAPSQVK